LHMALATAKLANSNCGAPAGASSRQLNSSGAWSAGLAISDFSPSTERTEVRATSLREPHGRRAF
jgi:hypothetical protein